MDAVLITLGVLGVGAILISVYVFTVAARTYVSNDDRHARSKALRRAPKFTEKRTGPSDRRSGEPVEFPLKLHGRLILEDRRVTPDRRVA